MSKQPRIAVVGAGLGGAAAAGLLLSTGIKMLLPLRGKWPALAIVALALIAIAWLRLPLLPTMLVLAPLSILLMWRLPS